VTNYNKKNLIFIGITICALAFIFKAEFHSYKKRNIQKKNIQTDLKTKIYPSDIALFASRNIAKTYVKKMKIAISSDLKDIRSLIYGTKTYGYYELTEFTTQDNFLNFEFISPGFQEKIEFYAKTSFGTHHLITKKITQPHNPILKEIIVQRKGQMSHNFFLLGGVYFPKVRRQQKRAYFILVLNRIGEIIWAHVPSYGERNIRKYPTVKQVSPGEYAVMFGEKWSYFERFNYKGDISKSISPKEAFVPYVIHHDFILKGDNLIAFGLKRGYIRPYFLPHDSFKTWSYFFKKPVSFLGATIEKVNLKTNKAQILWDPFKEKSFGITKNLSWARNTESGLHQLNNRPMHFTKWGEEESNADWLHANSIHESKEGYLVSFRNISKIVMFDKDFKIKWTLGQDKSDTYYLPSEDYRFYHQHHATLLENGDILLLDNHTFPPAKYHIGSRVLILRRNEEQKTAHVVWNYRPSKYLLIGNRGSVEQLDNKNLLSFYPRSLLEKDHLIEIGYDTHRPVGHFAITFARIKKKVTANQLKYFKKTKQNFSPYIFRGGGNRAVPIKTIGKEKFLGYKIETAN
jgi:hypothetical protein